ncbi:hypothetical protein J4219_07515 [Candidatus Woesearchaeota archaeon]|nr:hypothetical protein [Candidatus Woesearchaeota archaeon]
MTERQKPSEERKEEEPQGSDLERRVVFPHGSPKGIQCGYCRGQITQEQTPVIREFSEKTGLVERVYHDNCADEYAEELTWINMPAPEKKRRLNEAKKNVRSVEEIVERYTTEAKAARTPILKEAVAVAVYAAVPFIFARYVQKNEDKRDVSLAYGLGLFADITNVTGTGVFAFTHNEDALIIALTATIIKTAAVAITRHIVRSYPQKEADRNSHFLWKRREELAELEKKIKKYEGRSAEPK